MPPVWRALLFMPGDDRRKIEKAATLNVDAIIMDLEDGVALSQKGAARVGAASALRELNFGRCTRFVRINPVGSPYWRDDLAAVLPELPDGIVLPKAEDAAHIREVCTLMSDMERAHGLPSRHMGLLAIVETGLGVVNVREIAGADHRLAGLVFGAEDFASDIGATRTANGDEVFYARSAVVVHARAHRLAAIDTPHIDFRDLDGLRSETEQVSRMGYTGKLAIHPSQVDIIQQVFTPSQAQIGQAIRLIEAHDAQQAAGSGVFALDDKMVDMPMIRAAESVLARARAAGLLPEDMHHEL